MLFSSSLVLILLRAQVAHANTEVLIMNYRNRYFNKPLFETAKLKLSASLKDEFLFGAGDTFQQNLYTLQNLSEGVYLIRICWPASHPADMMLLYEPEYNTLVAQGSSKDVVPLQDPEMTALRTVPYQLHLEYLKLSSFSKREIIHTLLGTAMLILLSIAFLFFLFRELN